MNIDDVREQKGDKILFQLPENCNHPVEWCKQRTSILDAIYYHCYKCNSDVSKEQVRR